MTVELNLSNDKELRDFIKDMIHGQVKSVMREEIKSVLNDVVYKTIKGDITQTTLSFLIREEIKKVVESELKAQYYGDGGFVKNTARTIVNDYIKKAFAEHQVI